MKFTQAKNDLINFWGVIGTAWGINKTMAQIYALLLVSKNPMSIEEIMDELHISRGNASMNVRALIDWGLAFKEIRPGERKEYFCGEKDVWEMSRKVAAERRKREIEPLLKKLKQVKKIESTKTEDVQEFEKVVNELYQLVDAFDSILKKFMDTDNKMVIKSLQMLLAMKKS